MTNESIPEGYQEFLAAKAVIASPDRRERRALLDRWESLHGEDSAMRLASIVVSVLSIRKGARPGLRPDRAVTQPG